MEQKRCEAMDCDNLFTPINNKCRRCRMCHRRNSKYKDGTVNQNRREVLLKSKRRRNRVTRKKINGKWSKPGWEIKMRENLHTSKCVFCGTRKDLTLDHRKKISEGGLHELVNIQILCWPCHEIKDA